MKTAITIVILASTTAFFACIAFKTSVEAYPSATAKEYAVNAQGQSSFSPSNDNASNDHAEGAQNDRPHWYETAEWWLVIAAIPTLIFVGWQSRETARSAKASNRNVEAVMDERRARIEIIAGNVALNTNNPIGIGVSLKNGGPTMAFIKGGRVRLLRTDQEITPDYAVGVDIPFTGTVSGGIQTPTQMAVFLEPTQTLTVNDVVEINGQQRFIHFYGFVRYQDIYKRIFQVRIHLRWFVHTGLVMPGQITVYWEPAGKAEDNSDTEQKQPRKNWIERLDEWLDAQSPN
jgi:hypothetical protein